MKKTIFRIDDRLIHGQVIEGWVHNLNLTRITIVSDRVVKDEDYIIILRFSVPQEIKVDILEVKEMHDKVKNGYLEKEDSIILFECADDVLALLDRGTKIDSLNVGCLHYNGRNRQIRKNVAVSKEDIRNFEDINAMGTKMECRALPQDKKINLMELIAKLK